jgi:phospholipase C
MCVIGRLPKFVFLQPRMTAAKGPPTWQHPDASVKEGEKLIQSIYQALRTSAYWNKLAFMVTYDEHG